MKQLLQLSRAALLLLFLITFVGCSKDDDPEPENEESIIPETFQGRDTEKLGEVTISSRKIELSVWDHATVDGDIVSIYVNGEKVIDQYTLKGTKKTIDVELKYKGYNYILLYAHNEGDLSPNTCSIEILDGDESKSFVLSSDLSTNGAVDIIVK